MNNQYEDTSSRMSSAAFLLKRFFVRSFRILFGFAVCGLGFASCNNSMSQSLSDMTLGGLVLAIIIAVFGLAAIVWSFTIAFGPSPK